MTELSVEELKTELAIFEPSEVVKISVGDLSAPVQTGVELSKLAVLEKNILVDLLAHTEREEVSGKLILHPEALSWARELRMLYKDIHEMTSGVQEKVMMKKMDIIGALYKQMMKDNKPKDIIKKIRELQDGG